MQTIRWKLKGVAFVAPDRAAQLRDAVAASPFEWRPAEDGKSADQFRLHLSADDAGRASAAIGAGCHLTFALDGALMRFAVESHASAEADQDGRFPAVLSLTGRRLVLEETLS